MANLKDIVRLESSKLDVTSIIESVVVPNCGAVSSFIGTTRDNFEEKKVVKLEYEAYEPMALKEMQAVCDQIRSKWNVENIAIFHRLGEVPVTQASIVIAISSPHRQECLLAVQFAIDAVKTSVPIWKKEIYENDEPQWKENKECSWAKSDPIHQSNATCVSSEKKEYLNIENGVSVINEEVDFNNICSTVEIETQSVNVNDTNMKHDDANEFVIDLEQVQIKADAKELNRRIETFISRKREQVNALNKHGFFYRIQNENEVEESTCVCARVNAVFIKRHDSKHHIKVHRAQNQWSHQNIKPAIPVKLENESNSYPPALDERLTATEKILGINKPVPRDIYDRLKKIEDRLLFLESISPEYRDLWSIDDCESVKSFEGNLHDINDKSDFKSAKKRAHSPADIDPQVNEFEERYVKKVK